MEVRKKGLTIQSLQIGIDIIDVISKQGKPLKFTDIQQLTQMTKSNLYKYLNTLVQTGLLYRDKASGHYTLGAKLIQYGMAAADQGMLWLALFLFLKKKNEPGNIMYSSLRDMDP
ncbi:helix-turn-helix domain-containing protein [Terrilactibacillus sp. S3-3]|nr:helix-turn-helix domain-containing protein [Terrilactibacillus sp. S3-3]